MTSDVLDSTAVLLKPTQDAARKHHVHGDVHTLSQPGLARVTQAITDVGWLDQFAPSVVISREAVRNAEQLSAESMLKVAGCVLGGNHCVAVLKKRVSRR